MDSNIGSMWVTKYREYLVRCYYELNYNSKLKKKKEEEEEKKKKTLYLALDFKYFNIILQVQRVGDCRK